MDAKSRSRGNDALVAISTVTPVFVVVASISTLEKALLAATVFGAAWVAISERWQQREKQGFWPLVGLFALVNALAVWGFPVSVPFGSALSVSYPLAIAEGFFLYWLLGRLP